MHQVKINVNQLKIGMYVSNLDRPWTETPFLFQGFYVKEKATIEELTKYCKYVFVDVEQGVAPDSDVSADTQDKDQGSTTFEREFPKAKQIHNRVSQVFNNLIDSIKGNGEVNVEAISKEVEVMVEGCIKNPDAYVLLSKLKNKDDYTYGHCLSSSIYAVMLGTQMGLSKNEVEELAFGHMFFDIGKLKLPNELLYKEGNYTPEEKIQVRKHVNHSIEILNTMEGIKPSAIDIAKNHHERYDGSGYPNGLKGNAIPLYARIAGIIDTYDALTSKRLYSKQLSPHEAIHTLYKSRDKEFQKDILEIFIQCLGAYPTGSLIELNTGEVGIVLQQNKISRLRPRIMLILNRKKEFNDYFPIINLLSRPTNDSGVVMEISKTLDPGSYGINPAEFYLQIKST